MDDVTSDDGIIAGGKNGLGFGDDGFGDAWVVEEVESGLFGMELDSGGMIPEGVVVLSVTVVGIRIVHRINSKTSGGGGGGGTDGGLSCALVVMVAVVVLTVRD